MQFDQKLHCQRAIPTPTLPHPTLAPTLTPTPGYVSYVSLFPCLMSQKLAKTFILSAKAVFLPGFTNCTRWGEGLENPGRLQHSPFLVEICYFINGDKVWQTRQSQRSESSGNCRTNLRCWNTSPGIQPYCFWYHVTTREDPMDDHIKKPIFLVCF